MVEQKNIKISQFEKNSQQQNKPGSLQNQNPSLDPNALNQNAKSFNNSPTQFNSNSSNNLTLFILLGLIIVVILAGILYFTIKIKYGETPRILPLPENNATDSTTRVNFELALEKCLEENRFTESCAMDLRTRDINSICNRIKSNLKDACFFHSALINLQKDYCLQITNMSMQRECNIYLGIGGARI